MIVKVCGITRPEDAEAAARVGVDWIGLNFWPRSRRHVTVEQALAVAQALPGDVKKVGVFVNAPAPQVAEIAARVGLDLIQLHGDEDPEYVRGLARGHVCVRAVRVRSAEDLHEIGRWAVDTVLLDAPAEAYGGGGLPFDWTLARAARGQGKRILLAGGLTPENVARAVREVRPFGVDVATGVESAPGIKDEARMRRFVDNAKGAQP